MAQNTVKAKVKATGKEVEVYKSKLRSTWIEYPDCGKEYKQDELQF